MKTASIIQARTSSTRLPGKVLKSLPFNSDVTVLEQVVKRLKKSSKVDEIVIATTLDSDDDDIVKIAEKESVRWFRGSKEDVLSRYYFAAKESKADVVVRITSDCPCIDKDIVDRCISVHNDKNLDYTTNCLERTFPHGLDVEVFNFSVLEEAYLKADKQYEREHVCPYIHTTNRGKFKLLNIYADDTERGEDIRITVDTEEDYALLCAVYDYLYAENEFFGVREIVMLFNNKPWLKIINSKILQKKVCVSFEDELEEAKKVLKLQELNNVLKRLEKIKL
mgnify:CR=1 FL=1